MIRFIDYEIYKWKIGEINDILYYKGTCFHLAIL